jgi:hypothetical protein
MRRSARFGFVCALSLIVACAEVPEGVGQSADPVDSIASADTSDSVIITEIFYNPSDPTTAESQYEWIELYNPTSAPIDLTSLQLTVVGAGLPASSFLTGVGNGKIAPGAYAVIRPSNGTLPDETKVKASYSPTLKLSNSGLTVQIQRALSGVTVDSVTYLDGTPWPSNKPGIAIQLGAAAISSAQNDDGANWCGATATFDTWTNTGTGQTFNQLGTPGAPNSSCGGGPVTLRPAAGELVISEMMIHPTAPADTAEWIEIYNPSSKTFDLRGLQLASNASTYIIANPSPILSTPGPARAGLRVSVEHRALGQQRRRHRAPRPR